MRILTIGTTTVLTALALAAADAPLARDARAAETAAPAVSATPAAKSPEDDPYQERFCTALRTLGQAADRGFTTLRAAPKKARQGVWTAKLVVPGGTDCVIFSGEPAAYTCDLYAGDREDLADDAYRDASARLKGCLPDGWTSKEKLDGTHARTLATTHTSGRSIRVVERDASADAYLVEFWYDAAKK